jgi:hypothetical protein
MTGEQFKKIVAGFEAKPSGNAKQILPGGPFTRERRRGERARRLDCFRSFALCRKLRRELSKNVSKIARVQLRFPVIKR